MKTLHTPAMLLRTPTPEFGKFRKIHDDFSPLEILQLNKITVDSSQFMLHSTPKQQHTAFWKFKKCKLNPVVHNFADNVQTQTECNQDIQGTNSVTHHLLSCSRHLLQAQMLFKLTQV